MNNAYLVLGSNIEAELYVPAAATELQAYGAILIASRVWETEPVGFTEQANFLNAALLLETELSVDQLRNQAIPDIEHALDRRRDPNNGHGPRTIDIDIALFNDEIIARHDIPDPDILQRRFVAELLAEIAPDYVHPLTRQTLREIADSLRDSVSGMWPRSDVLLGSAAHDRDSSSR